jgi:hypothetical protein
VAEGSLTDDSQIHILWSPVSDLETGLDIVTSYEVYWNDGGEVDGNEWVLFDFNDFDWVLLVKEDSDNFTFEYLIDTGIIRSNYYKFWYLAINQHGVGVMS